MDISHENMIDIVSLARPILADNLAIEALDLFPDWESCIGTPITQDMIDKGQDRYQFNGRLYKVVQPHTPQENWTPDITPALYVRIDPAHAGTLEDPIPATVSMEYEYGKYYIESGIIYLCKRQGEPDGGKIVLHYMPSQLVGQYFEVVE